MERWYTLDSSHFSSLPALLSFSYFLLSAKSWVVYSHKVNWTCLLDQTEMVDGNTVYLIRNMIGSLRFQGSLQEESFVHSVALSCLTLCDPMNCSLPGSSVYDISQARILGWIAISFSRVLEVGDRQGGLVCCNPWGCKESDTNEQLNWTKSRLGSPQWSCTFVRAGS